MALNIRGGISLGIAQAGGLGQCLIIRGTRGLHGIQDEVGGAVDDAGDTLYLIAGQGAAQHAHHRDGGGHGSLKIKVHSGTVSGLCQLIRMRGHQRLISGNHGLAGIKRGEDQLARKINAADNLNYKVDILARNKCLGIIGQ